MLIIDKIKALFKIKSIVKDAKREVTTMEGTTTVVKPGWKTTEFWGKTAVQVILLLNVFVVKDNPIKPEIGLALVAGVEGVYDAVRALIKAFQKPPKP